MHQAAMSPESCPALVLNADYRPLSYYPLSLWSWQDAIKAVFLDRVNIVSEYDTGGAQPELRDAAAERGVAQDLCRSRRAIPPSPGSTCSCATASPASIAATREDLTFDHVVPRSKGGSTTWENVVAACSPCNLSKGGPAGGGQHVAGAEARSSRRCTHLHNNGRLFPPNYLHESWMDYLYWDTELEP